MIIAGTRSNSEGFVEIVATVPPGTRVLDALCWDEARSGATSLFARAHACQFLGRITHPVVTSQGKTTTFNYTYDTAGRLRQVKKNGAVTATHFYNANGNRDSVVTPSGTQRGITMIRLLVSGLPL